MLTASASAATFSQNPTQDAFVNSANPTSNYGGAGALAVSGAALPKGEFNSLLQFNLAAAMGITYSTLPSFLSLADESLGSFALWGGARPVMGNSSGQVGDQRPATAPSSCDPARKIPVVTGQKGQAFLVEYGRKTPGGIPLFYPVNLPDEPAK